MASAPDNIDELLQHGYRYAVSLTHDPQRARDLVQEACLSISQQDRGWTEGYLLQTIRNQFIDEYRRQQNVPMHALENHTPVDSNWEHAFSGLDAGYDDAMVDALERLRDDERELLFLSVIAGYPTRRLVALTGKPRGTVLSTLHRAKKKLHRWLSTEDEPESR